jgi:AcrR family transcriptional regulator
VSTPKRKPKKRGPGERAGLTRDIILTKAVRLLKAAGGGRISLRALANALGVESRTIHSHFKGGVDEFGTALVQKMLSDVARPFKPKESAVAYLRDLFGAFLEVVHGNPGLAKVVGLELSDNYFLNPLVPERILVALAEIGVADEELAPSLNLVMGALIGLLMTEAGKSRPGQKMAREAGKIIATLPPREHPMLKAHAKALVAHMAGNDKAESGWDAADRFAHLALSGLSGGATMAI